MKDNRQEQGDGGAGQGRRARGLVTLSPCHLVTLSLLAVAAVGALLLLLPRLRSHLSANRLVLLAGLAYAGTMVVLALVRNPVAVMLGLIPAGMGWIAVLSTVNAAMQLFLPGWVRARGLSAYQIVVFGGQALGSLLWGLVAGQLGLAFTIPAK